MKEVAIKNWNSSCTGHCLKSFYNVAWASRPCVAGTSCPCFHDVHHERDGRETHGRDGHGTHGQDVQATFEAKPGTFRNPARKSATRNRLAFTLVELMVVIGLIVLIAAIALPSIIGLFTAGADSQAHNIIAAQLARARAIAIQNNTYAGVHVQLADATTDGSPLDADLGNALNEDLADTCYSAVVWDDPGPTSPGHEFTLYPGSKPQKIPGSIAFGQLNGYVTNSSYNVIDTPALLASFTTFTVVFGPTGQVVTQAGDVSGSRDITFVTTLPDGPLFDGPSRLWNAPPAEPAATAITMFDYIQLKNRDVDTRDDYLNESGQFLPINVYTGQLFPRK